MGDRISFAAVVIHIMLPERLQIYDFSGFIEDTSLTFCMAKPGSKPRWQSLYNPFTEEVIYKKLIYSEKHKKLIEV